MINNTILSENNLRMLSFSSLRFVRQVETAFFDNRESY